MFQQLPMVGLPYEFDGRDGFEQYVTEVRSDERPAPRWGTLEMRACAAVTDPSEFAADLACAAKLDGVRRTLEHGSSAGRQRRVAHASDSEGRDLDAVVRHLIDAFDAGAPLSA